MPQDLQEQPKEKDSDKTSEKPSFNEQFGELIVKFLMAGGVSAGGVGAFWSLFKESDVPKAIASAAIGLVITYGASLLGPVHEGTKRRFGRAGTVIDKSIDDRLARLLAATTHAEDAYLLCQALDCRDYKSEGVIRRDRIFTPMLEEVFVPLELDTSALQPGFRNATQMEAEFQRIRCIWDFLTDADRVPAYRQLAIVAWGGFGKTTLLKHLAYMYGSGNSVDIQPPVSRLIPILLPLRKYRKQITQEDPLGLPELIMQYHVKELAELDERNRLTNFPSDWAKQVLIKGRALVMFDGFDEIPVTERRAFSRWISRQMQRFDKSVFILASRPTAYKENFIEPLRTKIWVRPLTKPQQTKFVHQWYACQEKLDRGGRNTPEVQREAKHNADNLLNQIHNTDRPELADLAKNPLLLNLLASYHRSEPGVELPRQRAELYQDICTLQLRKRPDAREIALPLSPADRQAVLQSVALKMMQRGLRLIDEMDLLELITQILKEQEHPSVTAADFLKQIVDVSELIVQQGLEDYEFAHLSFQEFLAAAQIKALRQEEMLYPHLKDADSGDENRAWWRQTIFLYAAQVNPVKLIREAIRQEAGNLASACYQETQRALPAEIEAEFKALQPQVQNAKYAELTRLLQVAEWEAADKETYRLMITTVGKEEGQWLDR